MSYSRQMRKKVWINTGDIVLVGLRDYQMEKADVILKYNAEEARNLKSYGELPESAKLNEGGGDEEDAGVEFTEMDDLPDTQPDRSGQDLLPSSSESESESESDDDEPEEDIKQKKKP